MPDGAYNDEWSAMTRVVFIRIKLIIGWYHFLFAIHSVRHLQNKRETYQYCNAVARLRTACVHQSDDNIVMLLLDYEQLVSISRMTIL